MTPSRALLIAVLTGALLATTLAAQELEPKAYSASPVGAAFVVVGVTHMSGDVVVDATLPLTDVEAGMNSPFAAGGYTFGLFDRLALVTAAVPWAWGDVSGNIGEQARAVSRSGFTDARLKFSINLVGNPAMGARTFARAPRKTIVGTSLTVTAPTGQYDGAKLINLGTNRWAFKPEVGVSVPHGPWDIDAYLGVWLFTHNADFFPGGRDRSQDPVVSLQGHASYSFRPRLWLAVDATWYAGGGSQIEGAAPTSGMNNSRLGATLSFPMGRKQSFKIAYSSGVVVRSGSNFKAVSVGWQFLRLTRP